jgi:hypothetical protein
MTICEYIKNMDITEMAIFLSDNDTIRVPHSSCNICMHDDGVNCTNDNECTPEYRIELYTKWLNLEINK